MSSNNTQAKGLIELSTVIDSAMNSEEVANENAFPLLFRDLIKDLHKSLNYPIEYTGIAILTAVANVIGTTAKVLKSPIGLKMEDLKLLRRSILPLLEKNVMSNF